jgi:hypothetical protein
MSIQLVSSKAVCTRHESVPPPHRAPRTNFFSAGTFDYFSRNQRFQTVPAFAGNDGLKQLQALGLQIVLALASLGAIIGGIIFLPSGGGGWIKSPALLGRQPRRAFARKISKLKTKSPRPGFRSEALREGVVKSLGSSSADRWATPRKFPHNSKNFFCAMCTASTATLPLQLLPRASRVLPPAKSIAGGSRARLR